ncbi:MAG: monomethylamine:corrinoid methyltransferase [Chloroflexi bacterium]|nr:MAG: monomethylamine:corrinoid methyltransferase [Chloroflexota bacterium]MBL1196712.1 monomethylamine:corrinoid methyltransferase [Chloroflexota bacterium]NOH14005.1 monomethylamine:corrinoid methyltransferase [Chloroflexota bacterium]
MQSNWLVEIMKRAQSGPFIKEKDFELKLIKRIKELVKEYDIKYDANDLVPADDDMADRVYQAGLQLFVEFGAYCQSTERQILFTHDEVVDIVAQAPSEVILGMGKDAVVMRHRGVEDPVRPIVHSGPTGLPASEEFHPQILLSYAQEPLVDCLGAGSVATYMGEGIIPGTPLELLGARRDASVAREAVRMAGRPGMHINDVAVPLTCSGKMAAFDPDAGLRSCDGILVSQMVELKTDYDQLSRVAHLYNVGGITVDLMTPLIGGLGGRAEGTAVVSVADHLLGVVLYDADYHMFSLTHLTYVNNTDPLGIWIQAMVGQALSRNTPIILLNDIYVVSGAGTKELLYECAAGAVVGTVCGFNMQGAGTTGGFNRDHFSGLETRFIAEVSRASLSLTRQEASKLIPKIMKFYEDTLSEPNRGRPFNEVYDVDTVQPTAEWLDMYYSVKEDMSKLGLKFEYAPRPKA